MRKRLSKGLCYGLIFVMLLGFAGCGGSSKSADSATQETMTAGSMENGSSADFSYYSYADEEMAEVTVEEELEVEIAEEENAQAEQVQDTTRKLIRTVDMNVETRDFDGLLPLIEQKVAEFGGYIEHSDVYNGSSYRTYRDLRRASLTIRVPQDKLTIFIKDMEGVSNVTNCNQSVQDVTLTYVDLESHKKALLVEQERLLELLEIAESVEDIITIESRLSQVRYEIESMEAQLRSYDNRVNYSTVYVNINEVEVLTPVKEETTGERIVRGFGESVMDVIDGIKEFVIEFIISLPYLVTWGIIIGVVILIAVRISRRSKRKTEEKRAKALAQMQQQTQNQIVQNTEKVEQNDNTGI